MSAIFTTMTPPAQLQPPEYLRNLKSARGTHTASSPACPLQQSESILLASNFGQRLEQAGALIL